MEHFGRCSTRCPIEPFLARMLGKSVLQLDLSLSSFVSYFVLFCRLVCKSLYLYKYIHDIFFAHISLACFRLMNRLTWILRSRRWMLYVRLTGAWKWTVALRFLLFGSMITIWCWLLLQSERWVSLTYKRLESNWTKSSFPKRWHLKNICLVSWDSFFIFRFRLGT